MDGVGSLAASRATRHCPVVLGPSDGPRGPTGEVARPRRRRDPPGCPGRRAAPPAATGTWFSTTSTRQPAASADRAPVFESSMATQSRGVDAEQSGGVQVGLGVRLALADRVAGDDDVEGAVAAARRGPAPRTARTTSSPARRACRRRAASASSSARAGAPGHLLLDPASTTPSSSTSTICLGLDGRRPPCSRM